MLVGGGVLLIAIRVKPKTLAWGTIVAFDVGVEHMVMLGQEGLEFGSMLGRQEVIRIRVYIKGVARRRWLTAVRLQGRCC